MNKQTATLEKLAATVDSTQHSAHAVSEEKLSNRRTALGLDDWDMVPDADWLLKITAGLDTAELEESPTVGNATARQPLPLLVHPGMGAHTSAARMVPTLGARLASNVRRTLLLGLLAILGAVLLLSAGYLLMETTWLSNLYSAPTPSEKVEPAPAGAIEPAPAVAPPSVREMRDGRLAGTEDFAAGPSHEQSIVPPDIEEAALAGTDAAVLRDRGTQAYRSGDYAGAVALLEQSVALNGDDALTHYQLGLAYMSVAGRDHALDDAELSFRTAASLQPSWAAAHMMLAESFIRRGFFEEAVPSAREATRLDPTMSEGWLALGRAYEGAGDDASAQQAYAEAARYSPAPGRP